MNILEQINDRGKTPLLNMIKAAGHWPMLEGKNWDESLFDWKSTILRFRTYISKKDDDIFSGGKDLSNEVETVSQIGLHSYYFRSKL